MKKKEIFLKGKFVIQVLFPLIGLMFFGYTTIYASNTITTKTIKRPTASLKLTITKVDASQINLRWLLSADNANVSGYKIYRNGTKIGASTKPFIATLILISVQSIVTRLRRMMMQAIFCRQATKPVPLYPMAMHHPPHLPQPV